MNCCAENTRNLGFRNLLGLEGILILEYILMFWNLQVIILLT